MYLDLEIREADAPQHNSRILAKGRRCCGPAFYSFLYICRFCLGWALGLVLGGTLYHNDTGNQG